MQTAQFHRGWWCYENNLGIAKIHHEALGIVAILFEGGSPVCDVNFLNKDEISYYWQRYRKAGVTLLLGAQIDRDVDVIRAVEKPDLIKFPEINLEIKAEGGFRYFRPIDGEWQLIENCPAIAYQRCDSLVFVN